MAVYAFIPARVGSERVPGKNWTPMLGGRSLVEIAVQCASLAGVDEIVVSTDAATALYGLPLGVKIHARKPEHATDTAQIEDAILDWGTCRELKPDDTIVLLQPTSPLRRPSTVRRCIEARAATVTLDTRAPFRGVLFDLDESTGLAERGHYERPRSQDIEPQAEENGGVYAFPWHWIEGMRTRLPTPYTAVVTPWWEAFEIDTPEDVEVMRALWPVFGGRP